MSNENPSVDIRGQDIAIINGKTFSLLRAYQDASLDPSAEGWFFLAVAGKTPLRKDDLAEHWTVVRSGDVYLAMRARTFSYHLIDGDEPEADWPSLKAAADLFTFVGPTEEAAREQLRLLLDRIPGKNHREVLAKSRWVDDQGGSDTRALVVPANELI